MSASESNDPFDQAAELTELERQLRELPLPTPAIDRDQLFYQAGHEAALAEARRLPTTVAATNRWRTLAVVSWSVSTLLLGILVSVNPQTENVNPAPTQLAKTPSLQQGDVNEPPSLVSPEPVRDTTDSSSESTLVGVRSEPAPLWARWLGLDQNRVSRRGLWPGGLNMETAWADDSLNPVTVDSTYRPAPPPRSLELMNELLNDSPPF